MFSFSSYVPCLCLTHRVHTFFFTFLSSFGLPTGCLLKRTHASHAQPVKTQKNWDVSTTFHQANKMNLSQELRFMPLRMIKKAHAMMIMRKSTHGVDHGLNYNLQVSTSIWCTLQVERFPCNRDSILLLLLLVAFPLTRDMQIINLNNDVIF